MGEKYIEKIIITRGKLIYNSKLVTRYRMLIND